MSDAAPVFITLQDGRREVLTKGQGAQRHLRNIARLRRRQQYLAQRILGNAPGKKSYDEAEENALRWACEVLESLLGIEGPPVDTSLMGRVR